MKKLIPFVALILLCACNNTHPKAAEATQAVKAADMVASNRNTPMQTIHQFVGYLKNNDVKSVQAMLPLENRAGSHSNRQYYNHEIIQIANMWMALEHDDVDDSHWVSDTVSMAGGPHLFFVGKLKRNTANPNPQPVFRFVFSLANSDTVLTYFDYNPPKPGRQKASVEEDRPMQLMHQFIGFLKNKDSKNARRMLGLSSIPVGNGSKKDSISRMWLQYAVNQIDTAVIALQQNDIDESTWEPEMDIASGTRTLLISGYLKEKPGNRYSKTPIAFGFEFANSDMGLDFFDFAP